MPFAHVEGENNTWKYDIDDSLLGAIVWHIPPRKKEIPLDLKKFTSGFLDGDGCVSIPSPTDVVPKPTPTISASQACDGGVPPELELLRSLYGGSICRRKPVEGRRQAWDWTVKSKEEIAWLLEDMVEHMVLKRAQVRLALQYLQRGRQHADLYSQVISAMKAHYDKVNIDDARITAAWTAGLFAADGTTAVYRRLTHKTPLWFGHAAIVKRECPRLMRAIARAVGVGYVTGEGRYFARSKAAKRFLEWIQPHVRGQKAEQVTLTLHFLTNLVSRSVRKRGPELFRQIEEIECKLKALKQQ